jgi:hypothetical protein
MVFNHQNIIWVIKSRRMRWVGECDMWGRGEVYTQLCWGNRKLKDHLEDLGIDGRMLLKLVLRSLGREGMGCINLS